MPQTAGFFARIVHGPDQTEVRPEENLRAGRRAKGIWKAADAAGRRCRGRPPTRSRINEVAGQAVWLYAGRSAVRCRPQTKNRAHRPVEDDVRGFYAIGSVRGPFPPERITGGT